MKLVRFGISIGTHGRYAPGRKTGTIGNMAFRAPIDPRLRRALGRMAALPSAEAWRRLRPMSTRLGVRHPSYQTVRRLLVFERHVRSLRRARRRSNEKLFADLLAGRVPWSWLNERLGGIEPG